MSRPSRADLAHTYLIKGNVHACDNEKEKVVSTVALWPLYSGIWLLFLLGLVVIAGIPESYCLKVAGVPIGEGDVVHKE